MDHPFGWLSLLPPLIAIAMAIATRRVVLSLLIGVIAGALITCQGDVFRAVHDTLELHLWRTVAEEHRLRVFAFTMLMGTLVGIIHENGGMQGLIDVVTPWAKNPRRGQVATWAVGLLIFFDDYANSLLVGKTMRPLCDRLRISREKLAYVVDSTAAPVSGLALVSTWVAGEIDYVQQGLNQLPGGSDLQAFDLFVRSIPYRFYVLWALLLVPLIGLLNRDFGPMLSAERLARRGQRNPAHAQQSRDIEDVVVTATPRWFNALIPIIVTVAAVVWLLYVTGKRGLESDESSLWQIFGAGDSYFSLLWGSFAGVAAAIVLTLLQRLLTFQQLGDASARGAKLMLPALAILWLAASLSSITGNSGIAGQEVASADYPHAQYRLYTGEFLTRLITEGGQQQTQFLSVALPTIIFLLAAVVSFTTGTSWGTMAIVMPITIPLAVGVLGGTEDLASSPFMLASIGSVLAGAIFGDHCSPISDTTVLSSQASSCNHMAHVWTQFPYAVLVAVISIVFGTLPIALGLPVWISLAAGTAALPVLLLVIGRKVE